MPESPTAVLGTFSIDAQWPLTFTPPARTITVSSNSLATAPVQVNDYISDFGVINIPAIIKGVASEGETAADHVLRQVANLTTEIAKSLEIETKRTGLIIIMQPSEPVLQKFKDGTYTGFSIGGRYVRNKEATL